MKEIMSLGELLAQGGWAMFPIYLCSFVALTVTLAKLIELRRRRLSDLSWLEPALDAVDAHDYRHAELLCMATPHPAAKVLNGLTEALRDRPEFLESEARRLGDEEIRGIERHLTVLSLIAEVAPLLGLLGTVVGMVDLFTGMQGMEQGAVAMSALASGIWKALLTTAAGLCVAVPTLAAHTYLSSRIDDTAATLENMVRRILYIAGHWPAREAPSAEPGQATVHSIAAE